MLQRFNTFLILSLLVPSFCWAASAVVQQSADAKKARPKAYNIGISTTVNTSTDKPDSYTHSVSSDVAIDGTYIAGRNTVLMASFGYSKQLDGLLEDSFADAFIGVSQKILRSKNVLSLSLVGGVVLPTNQDRRELDSFRGAVKAGTTLSYKLDRVGLPGVSLSWSAKGIRNFYEYTSNRYGSVNKQAMIGNSVAAQYAIGKFSFSFAFGNTHSWSYSNQRMQDSFSMSQRISFAATNKLAFAVGHVNGGDTFQAYGSGSNIEFYDPLRSTVYLTVGYTY